MAEEWTKEDAWNFIVGVLSVMSKNEQMALIKHFRDIGQDEVTALDIADYYFNHMLSNNKRRRVGFHARRKCRVKKWRSKE